MYQWTHLYMESKKIIVFMVVVQQLLCELWALMYDAVEIKLIVKVFKLKQPCSSSTRKVLYLIGVSQVPSL